MIDNKMREALSDEQHKIWSHWMKYMFTQGQMNEDGSWTMPSDKVARWQKQMNTDYQNLSENEKESDRHQADKILKVMKGI